jgi:hypothetical protein
MGDGANGLVVSQRGTERRYTISKIAFFGPSCGVSSLIE